MNTTRESSVHSNVIRKAVALAMSIAMLMAMIQPVRAAEREVPITSVSFPTKVTMNVGDVKTLSVNVYPSNTTYKTNIHWGYQPMNSFTVGVNGYGTYWGKPSSETLTAVKAGEGYLFTEVRVYDSNGKYKRSFDLRTTVNVNKKAAPVKRPLQRIALNKTALVLQAGNIFNLTVSYTPSNTTDNKNVTWSTSNSSVATVSKGKITTRKSGVATITARVGNKTASCRVTVIAKPAQNVVKNNDGFVDASAAYRELNNFRTTKNVWQWNSNNKTKTYFNTNSSNKLYSLKKDSALEATARVRAKEIATKFSHTRPNGSSCFTKYPSMSYMGEIIAYGYSTAKSVTEAWKETNDKYSGQGHRRNMLNKKYNAVGIACYKKNGTYYWVQSFGRR